jgi:hypothetical protein
MNYYCFYCKIGLQMSKRVHFISSEEKNVKNDTNDPKRMHVFRLNVLNCSRTVIA